MLKLPFFIVSRHTNTKSIPWRRGLTIVFFLSLSFSFLSCGSSKPLNYDYVYFRSGADTVTLSQKERTVETGDLLSIQVYSKTSNQEQAAIFNIPAAVSSTQGYQVNPDGTIEMPRIGKVKADGMTKDQLQKTLEQKLTDYVKDPTVVVRLLHFNINVLGEVRTPGTQKFTVDRVTIIDALSGAGDLTDFGKRDSVTVIREEEGKKIYYSIDLRSRALFESPVYLMQPNDVVYVSPNKFKLKNLNVDPEKQRKTGLAFAVISTMVSIATLVLFALN